MTKKFYPVSFFGGVPSLRFDSAALPGRALADVNADRGDVLDACCRIVERRWSVKVVCVTPQGTACDGRGEPESHHYELTLGQYLRGKMRGASVDGRVWVAIPVRKERAA